MTVLVPNSYFRLLRIFHAVLPGSLPRATIKRRGNILSLSSTQAFRAGQTCPVFLFSLQHWPAAEQASQHDRTHILSLRFQAAGGTSQHERPYSLFFTDTLTCFKQSTKHHEETSSNFWTVGVWEVILSSFIFPSKPTDPQRNKLDIFNSCFNFSNFNPSSDDNISTPAFNFSILIRVLTTASQLLL